MREKLREYARLLMDVGLAVKPDQPVLISAPLSGVELVRLCAEAAYDRGASEVIADWGEDSLTQMKYLRGADHIFDEFPKWQADKMMSLAGQGMARLAIVGTDPELLKNVKPDRLRRAQQASGKATEAFSALQMANAFPWCVAAMPIPSWAAKVFPGKGEDAAMEALWDAIFASVRVTGDGKASERWQAHVKSTQARCAALNGYRLKSLRYENSLGTDLTVELPEGHLWMGGGEEAKTGQTFVANIPTEEIFTAPKRDGVSGRVVSSMPFSLQGNLISSFAFTLEKGKIVDIEASKADKALLQDATSLDEGAAYLGEVALVPYDSPISRLGILFYNTLFDENASCHFAFGKAYPCIEGGDLMTAEELLKHGVNDSMTHKDFMVGTKDLCITGTTGEGKEMPVFVDGNFAF